MSKPEQIFFKISKILKGIVFINILLIFKIWHLSFFEKEKKIIESYKPQTKTILQKAQRGIIKDRFDIPLAINRIRYNVAIYYGQILQIPRVRWTRDKHKKKIKTYPRKEYIQKLSFLLSKSLDMEAQTIEDLIHSKASLFAHVPFILRENISETTYYKLRLLEKDWPGLYTEISSERYYPHQTTASDIIGYMGSIDKKEYLQVANEMKILSCYLNHPEVTCFPDGYNNKFEISSRFKQLKEKAYQFNDLVGKCGIEKKFEEELRGSHGKKSYLMDIQGTFIKQLPLSLHPIPGRNITLTLSQELQDFAEKLLSNSEASRDGKSTYYDKKQKKRVPLKQPWIKGGAIIAMDPKNGEILAMASYPGFDPNDFILPLNPSIHEKKRQKIHKWMESTSYLSDIWNGELKLTRQRYDLRKKQSVEKQTSITWDSFLLSIMPNTSSVYLTLQKIGTVKTAIQIQEDMETILYHFDKQNALYVFDTLFPDDPPCAKNMSLAEKENYQNIFKSIKIKIAPALQRLKVYLAPIQDNMDKLFFIDLCKIAIFNPAFSDELITHLAHLSLADYHKQSQNVLRFMSLAKKTAFNLFEKSMFQNWRSEHFTSYLKEKREEEKKKKIYAKPYIDYLHEKKHALFQQFWKKKKQACLIALLCNLNHGLDPEFFACFSQLYHQFKESPDIDSTYQNTFRELCRFLQTLPPEELTLFFKTVRSFNELNRPLYGVYRKIQKDHPLEKDLAAKFYPSEGFGYLRSTSFQEPAPQGSIFKLLTAYEVLRQNPDFTFTMSDKIEYDFKHRLIVGRDDQNRPYPRIWKKGRLPKSASSNMGTIDLLSAIERSSNPYFSIIAANYLKSPIDLSAAALRFGFGKKTNISLLGEIPGHVPNDLDTNRTGLYSLAIGHHTLVVTPLQTALFLSCLANGKYLFVPKIIRQFSGKERNLHSHYPFQEELESLGISFPIFRQSLGNENFTTVQDCSEYINKEIPIDATIRDKLFLGMKRVVSGNKGTARASIIKSLYGNFSLARQYKALSSNMIGKTSTAEIYDQPYILPSETAKLYKHTWFCAISFEDTHQSKLFKDPFKSPELVVVVYLRYSDSGKEAAPLAAQMIQKWRDLKNKYR